MKKSVMLVRAIACVLVLAGSNAAWCADEGPLRFSVTYDASITDSFTGRVYVMLVSGRHEPRFGPSWFNPQPFFAMDVKDWTPGEALVFDDTALSFPAPLSQLEEQTASVQAVMRRSLDSPNIGTGKGTAYSTAREIALDGDATGVIELTIDNIIESERPFPDREGVREISMTSELLSDFHGREITMRAAVITPGSDEPGPALYHIPGFGGDHRFAFQLQRYIETAELSERVTHIVLNPLCLTGHHVFADSANNGPVGEALVTEFIPYIEEELSLVAQPYARGVTGISSGGWSSLWLQVTYPEFFGGVWSIAPDPVDFRSFQYIDLYDPDSNMYVDDEGNRRPLARQTMNGDEHVIIWYDEFAKMEWVMGDGGQLGSFEAVFSPRSDTGGPKRLFDRNTGEINGDVAEAWKKYDIRLILEENWATLGPKLAGKLHVHMGEFDTYYLEGAAILLKESLAKLGSDAVVEIHSGKNHGSVFTRELMQQIDNELGATFDAAHKSATEPAATP